MVITYFGAQCVKLQFGDLIIGVNPIEKAAGLQSVRFGADLALVSANRPDMNGTDSLGFGEKQPFVIEGAGEYEIKGVPVLGILADVADEKHKYVNTIYVLELEGMRVCFLGAQRNPELSSETLEAIGNVDILFVPIGGEDVLTPAQAEKISVSLDAKLVIPVHYGDVKSKELATFLKEAGAEGVKPEEKLTLKKKDLEGKEGEVVLLIPPKS